MSTLEHAPPSMENLARNDWQRAWISDLVEVGVLELSDHYGPEWKMRGIGWAFIQRLERAGFLITFDHPGLTGKQWVNEAIAAATDPFGDPKRHLVGGYPIYSDAIHPLHHADGRFVYQGFDPSFGQLIGPMFSLLDKGSDCRDQLSYYEARSATLTLLANLPDPGDWEIVRGLLPGWDLQDALRGFTDLLSVLPHFREYPSSNQSDARGGHLTTGGVGHLPG